MDGTLQQELLDHYWARVELLALEAESGEYVTSELGVVVGEAAEAFAGSGSPSGHRDEFISLLTTTAEAYREASPSYASIFSRAALLVQTSSP